MVDEAIVERVRIRKHINDILNYRPPKGFDFTFHDADPDNKNPRSPHLYDAQIVCSNVHPDYPKQRHDMTSLLAGWKNLVSDRVAQQHAGPLKHKIVTVIEREKVTSNTTLQERIANLPAEKKFKNEDNLDTAEIFNEEVKDVRA